MVGWIAQYKKMTYVVQVSNEPVSGSNPNSVMAAMAKTVVYADARNDITKDVVYNLNKRVQGRPAASAPKAAGPGAAADQPGGQLTPAADPIPDRVGSGRTPGLPTRTGPDRGRGRGRLAARIPTHPHRHQGRWSRHGCSPRGACSARSPAKRKSAGSGSSRVATSPCGSGPPGPTPASSSSAPTCPVTRRSGPTSATSSPASGGRPSSTGEAVVEMVEHVMAALAGLRVDNCRSRSTPPRRPAATGRAAPSSRPSPPPGIVELDRPRDVLVIDRPVTVREGQAVLTAHPGDRPATVLAYQLDYGADARSAPEPVRRRHARVVRATNWPPAGRSCSRPRPTPCGRRGSARGRPSRPAHLRRRRADRQHAAVPRRVRPAQDPRHGRRPRAARAWTSSARVGRRPLGPPAQRRAGPRPGRDARRRPFRRLNGVATR